MTLIRSRKHTLSPYMVALAASLSTAPVIAHGEAAADYATEVTVKGEKHPPYKADKLSTDKHTQDLVDTPQTLTVIKKALLEEQGATTLIDALRNTPGITMQLGENGSTSSGDTFQMRGFSSQSSVFLDGIRDLGAISRDTFNIEQVEVAKGPAGTDIGRGASSGYINLVSKLPPLNTRASASASLYSQGGARVTADANIRTGATSAFRLNVMDQDVNVVGRDYVKNSGYGIAPSYGIGIGTDTRVYIFAQVMHQDNVPDGGIPTVGLKGFYNANANLNAGAKVDPANYYGSVNDYEMVDAALLTSKIEHEFGRGVRLTNTTRYGQTTMERILTGVNGLTATTSDPATWTVARTRQGVDQTNTILANTTNFNLAFTTGEWVHSVATGTELTYESQRNDTLSTTLQGVAATIPAANLYNPNPNDVLPLPKKTGAYTDGNTTTVSAYVFDTIKLNDAWLINGGLRIDSYTTKTNSVAIATTSPYAATAKSLAASGTLASWNLGAVYKPRDNGSLYIAYGNALTPPGGNSFALSDTASSTSNAAFDPTETGNLEIGTKWEFLKKKLSVTAAWYSTEVTNELTQLDAVTNTYVQLGKRKVDGLELGLIGQITPDWQISAGAQTLHTKIETGTTGNSAEGAVTRWSPDLTATVWTSYKVTRKLTVGGGFSYTSDQLRVVDPTAVAATSVMPKIPAAWVANAMASYDLSQRLALQLNIYNLFDTDYISTLNNGGSRVTMGKPLSGTLTLNVRF